MSNPDAPEGETPMQRALRLKKSAQAARPKPSGADKVRRADARAPSGASRPATRR